MLNFFPTLFSRTFLYVSLLLATLLYSCSWVNSFYVVNTTSKSITLDFTLADSVNDFGIFYTFKTPATAYELTGKNDINYEKPVKVFKESLGKDTYFRIVLPKHTALQIGALFNDKYTSHKQTFINGHVFNLQSIKIMHEKGVQHVFPDDFDAHLKKESGDFIFSVNP